MDSIGRLAGGIAHDFNNILSEIIGYSELALMNIPAGHPVRESLQTVHDSGMKASALTRQLLAFSRKQVLEMKVIDLNLKITGVAKIMKRLVREDITLEIKTDPALTSILADQGQIEQIVMNLVVNSRDAMPFGGWLSIETGQVVHEELDKMNMENFRQTYAIISVTDTGEGMTADAKEKIFNPFFTTKEKGKGMVWALPPSMVS